MTKLAWIVAAGMTATLGLVAWQNHRLAARLDTLATSLRSAAPQRGEMPSVPPTACYLGPQFVEQVAAELHELLPSGAGMEGSGGKEDAAVAEARQAREAERVRHAEAAHRKLDEILERGRISPDEVRALAGELTGASSEERDKLRARIAAAVNRDELIADDPRMLYP